MSAAERIGTAYDAVAAEYDRQLGRDRWMRRILWRHFDRLFGPGDRVLDAGCGTGIDTIHLASRHVRVTAVDASTAMVAELRSKLARLHPPLDVQAEVGDVNDVAGRLSGPFDGIVSSFAALNTVDLHGFAATAARLLRPGGRIVCHLLSLGRAGASPEKVIEVAREPLAHLSLPPSEVYRRFFEARFVKRAAYALGFLVSRAMETRLPEPLLDLLGRVEAVVGAAQPLVGAGRFFVLDLARRPVTTDVAE
jgi:ubiquinone/menaquinone biosynthesis C-methylase UbiE